MKTIGSADHRQHFPRGELAGGELVRPHECPERWDTIVQALEQASFPALLAPAPFDRAWAAQIHDADFLSFLETAWHQWQAAGFNGDAIPTVFPARRMQQRVPNYIDGRLGYYAMAIETPIMAGTWTAATSSAACAQTAQKLIGAGDQSAFALCRPPGHHAATDLYGGYCFMNNAAIAAQGFLNDGASRVAILDVDFHHGNGTQDIFYARDDVLYLSLHGDPKDAFPHFLGYADETGHGAGDGYNVNYPLPPGSSYPRWHLALTDALGRIRRYAPDALVVSLGVDTYENDPISFFKLTRADFSRYGAEIAALRLPTLFVMEGGYAVDEIGTNTVNVLRGFLNG